ncbi:MAG: MEDS domain-containing protein [Actinomycetota bacterium]|nr:MEDS domain-containing protein [Actinomycetota bacterium]
MDGAGEDVGRLRARLCEQALLFDDPDTYIAGVKDALAEVERLPSSAAGSLHARLSAASRRHDHLVEFYESDGFLVDSVVQFLAPALGAGEAAIVVATRAHRDKFEAALTAEGLDVTGAHARGQLAALDAAQTLAAFLVDGTPDPARFRMVLGGMIDRAAEGGRRVCIYGEMVALLWEEGNISAALMLEDLWNELACSHPFSLLCAYPMGTFDGEETTAAFRTVCKQHSAVIPGESYSNLADPDDRLRAVALLQQEARARIHERRELQRKQDELEAALDRLRDRARRIECVAMLVHDMQTPATVISESLGLLRESWSKLDEDDTHEFLTEANESIQLIQRHVGDLLLALWFSDFILE